ncbi:MAG: prepilin-type N-terminal cleavage/methylation domain-containing protein [Lachnospiraceae bacterium]
MKKRTSGMTIVEVIVAFAVLMIGLAGLYKATLLSSNMVAKATQIEKQVDELMNQYYKGELVEKPETSKKVAVTITPPKGTEVTIPFILHDGETEKGYHIYYFTDGTNAGK